MQIKTMLSSQFLSTLTLPNCYLPLADELKCLYEDYKFEVVPIVVGATSLVTNTLAKSLEKLGVSDIKAMIKSCQKKALLGALKIVKSFMKM